MIITEVACPSRERRSFPGGVVAKRPNAAGCKPAGFTPSEVRILPAPPPLPEFPRPNPPTALTTDHRSLRRATTRLCANQGAPASAGGAGAALRPVRPPSAVPSFHNAGVAQLAEHQPSKLRVAGPNPVSRSMPARFVLSRNPSRSAGAVRNRTIGPRPRLRPRGSVVEHFLGKEGVTGSIPVVGSTLAPVLRPVNGVTRRSSGDPSRLNRAAGAALIVALRSEYTRYSSLARLVSRAPHRSRRSRHPAHGPQGTI